MHSDSTSSKRCPCCGGEWLSNVDAHIIPRAFWRAIQSGSQNYPLRLHQPESNNFPKRMPIGIFDKDIWCPACEVASNDLDKYASQILLTPIDNFEKVERAFLLKLNTPRTLQDFFISLIWRASRCKNDFFGEVNLGRLEEVARAHIRDPENGQLARNIFQTVISYSGSDSKVLVNPTRVRKFHRNFVCFHLGLYQAHVKVDSEPMPHSLRSSAIGNSQDLVVLSTPPAPGVFRLARAAAVKMLKTSRSRP